MKRLLAIGALVACGKNDGGSSLQVSLIDIDNGAFYREQTCDGMGLAPMVTWSGVPEATKSFALVVDDPDAPKANFVHWVVTGIPPSESSLAGEHYPVGALVGTNDFAKAEWGPPCPPSGTHHYVFRVYALDAVVGTANITRAALDSAMAGHILARGEATATYTRR